MLLAQRNPQARFMGGAWVFPGGAVSAEDGRARRAARGGARELREEAGIELGDPAVAGVLALDHAGRGEDPLRHLVLSGHRARRRRGPRRRRRDGRRAVVHPRRARWTPRRRGEILLVFPTIKHLEQISGFASAQRAAGARPHPDVRPVQPRVVVSGETARIVLPGEPGYDDPR